MRSRKTSAGASVALVAAVAAVGAALGWAQTQPPKEGEKPASVEGEVRNSVTGMPIVRAHVSLRRYNNNGFDRYGAMTNAEGKFRITGIPAAENYQVVMERVGYVVSPESVRTPLTLKPDEKKDNFHLKMIPVGTISGRVLDADGEPAEALQVQAEQGGREARMGVTDDRGHYRIGGLGPGKYRVRVVMQALPLPPEIRTDGTTEVHYASTYHPGTLDEKGAVRVPVGPGGEVTGIDIRMVRTPIVRLAGKVSGVSEGVKNAFVQVQRINRGQGGQGAQVKADGSFETWGLDPGRYSVRAGIMGTGDMMASSAVEVEVGDSDIDNIGLTLMAAEEIRGQLEFEDEAARQAPEMPRARQAGASQGGTAETPPPPRPRRIMLQQDGGMTGPAMGDVTEDGAFTIPKVLPGKYTVSMQGYTAYVRSTRVGDTASEGPMLDLNQGSGGARVTVTLSSGFGEIAGTVRDDKGPVAGAQVGVRNKTTSRNMWNVSCQADGTYRVQKVAPGTYKVAVMDEGEGGMTMDGPDESDEGVEVVEVRAKEAVTRDLKVRAVN